MTRHRGTGTGIPVYSELRKVWTGPKLFSFPRLWTRSCELAPKVFSSSTKRTSFRQCNEDICPLKHCYFVLWANLSKVIYFQLYIFIMFWIYCRLVLKKPVFGLGNSTDTKSPKRAKICERSIDSSKFDTFVTKTSILSYQGTVTLLHSRLNVSFCELAPKIIIYSSS